ncbi:MAG: SMC-Scp complex subunit ScpB [Bacteroidota bacterium]
MEIGNIIPHIEAVIFASDKALTALEITEIVNNAFGFMEDKIVLDQVESAIEGIVEKYNSPFYPFEIRQSGGGWQFLTKKDFHKTIAQLNGDKFLKRLSSAALETLAIIAYKQPITKSEIEAIRGVNCDYAVQRLLEKELVIITGRNENLPGKPLIYTTSKSFMDYFGINSADDLPKIKEVLADQAVEATYINKTTEGAQEAITGEPGIEMLMVEESAEFLAVTPDGELVSAVEEEPGTQTDPQDEDQETGNGEGDQDDMEK